MMKHILWILRMVVLATAALGFTGNALAESPREQLKQMVEQLQKTPDDSALRESIIKFAQGLKPAPAVPDEAERRMARGTAAFKGAKSVLDYQDAVKEFEQATLAAPWYGDAYFNLGVAQDKAENYEAALHSLKLAQLVSPDNKEIKQLIYEVEYRNEKAHSPEAVAEKQAQHDHENDASLLKSLDGAIFVWRNENGSDVSENEFRINGDQITLYRTIIQVGFLYKAHGNYAGQVDQYSTSHIALTGRRFKYAQSAQNVVLEYEISPNGQSIRLTSPPEPGYMTFIRK